MNFNFDFSQTPADFSEYLKVCFGKMQPAVDVVDNEDYVSDIAQLYTYIEDSCTASRNINKTLLKNCVLDNHKTKYWNQCEVEAYNSRLKLELSIAAANKSAYIEVFLEELYDVLSSFYDMSFSDFANTFYEHRACNQEFDGFYDTFVNFFKSLESYRV